MPAALNPKGEQASPQFFRRKAFLTTHWIEFSIHG